METVPAADQTGTTKESPSSPSLFRLRSFLILLLAVGIASLLMLRPFFVPVIMALITAGLLRPLYLFYWKWTGKREVLASSISLITVVAIGILPLAFLGIMLVKEGIKFVSYAQDNLNVWLQSILRLVQRVNHSFPFLRLDRIDLQTLLPKVLNEVLRLAMNILNYGTQSAANFFFQGIVFLFCLYYFFIDWQEIGRWVDNHSPLIPRHNEKLYERFLSMGRAIFKSVLLLGLFQGILTGAAFAVTGIPSPLFWGFVAFILSLLPVVGTALVWFPAGVILLIAGHPAGGIGLLAFGIIVISNVDNLLRPKLVGSDTALHPLAVFLSTLGGISLFGFAGFVLGPVIIALMASLLQIYREEFRPSLLKNGKPPKIFESPPS